MPAGRTLVAVSVAAALILFAVGAAYVALLREDPPREPSTPPPVSPSSCKESRGPGYAMCAERKVTGVIDGDTLDIEGGVRVRLVLVDAPDLGAPGGPEATAALSSSCSGTTALVDEDDFQVGADPFGRVLGVVRCGTTQANAAVLASGFARTHYAFCAASEFGDEAWAGCSAAPPPPPGGCDPAYPGVCLPSPPPDLDCGDVAYRSFRALPPDPHRFDLDGDGIGCEGPDPRRMQPPGIMVVGVFERIR
jgi:micrococcal nuclease